MKKKSISKLKKEAWDLFSKYIRTRDCLATTGTTKYGNCVTCGKNYDFRQLQAGHYIPGRHNSILFDERGVHAQCWQCNGFKKGDWVHYTEFMREYYGQKVINQLIKKDKELKQFQRYELEEMIVKYKRKVEEI